MRRSFKSLLISAAASAIAMGGLAACHNGTNNGRDTTGMSNSGAAGDLPAAATLDTTRKDTTMLDTNKKFDTTKPRP